MSEPFKLDGIDLDEVEPFEFTWDGETYICASPNSTDIRHVGAILENVERDPASSLVLVLGEEQYARLENAPGVFTGKHLLALMEKWAEHHGLDFPKSGGSAGPSKITRMR